MPSTTTKMTYLARAMISPQAASQEPEPYTLRSSRLGFSADQRLVFCTGHAKRGSSRVERR